MKAINKKAGTLFAGLLLAFGLVSTNFTGCSNGISSEPKRMEYGSITIKTTEEGSSSRSLDASLITSATIKVSGNGFEDISGTVTMSTTEAGKASATVENIPTGSNRVVTVTSNVDGATIRAVCNVEPGDNDVEVKWSTTSVANVYYYLIKDSVDVSNIQASSFSGKIPDVHASLFDAESFAEDFKNANYDATGLTSTDYILDFGTVTVTSSNATGYTLQITDIASEKKTIATADEDFELKAYPGTWKARVYDSTGTQVAEKNITVLSGETSTVDVKYSTSAEFDGIQIQVAKSLNYPLIHYWDCSVASYANTEWPGTEMLKDWCDDDYIYNFDGASSVSLLITNSSGNKLCGSNMYITSKGAYRITSSGKASSEYIPESGSTQEGHITLTVNSATPHGEAVKIYVSSTSGAPTIWAWTSTHPNITTAAGYPGPTMVAATDLNDNTGWYVSEMNTEKIDTSNTEPINIILNGNGSTISTSKKTTFWYDAAGVVGSAGAYYDSDPTTVPEPVAPTLSITPASGKEIGTSSSIKITANFGFDTPTEKSATINGTEHTLSEGVNTFSVSDITDEAGVEITVSAVLTNSVGTANLSASYTTKITQEDPFTWDNVNAYFVLTDRFANGDSTNDHSYNRKNGLSGDEDVATFHGGDLKGLTNNLDYFEKLGVNAIWITAPYEQAHGWVSGKGHKFPHYAFHGYYTLDWTAMDANMGTVEELRTFVNACHSKGIRVIMDVVMNHVGYNNQEDMITYNHGGTSITEHGWLEKTGCPQTENGCALNHTNCYYANYTVDWTASLWDSKWWGPWIRSFGYEEGSEYGGSCGGLPDVKHEIKNSVGMAPVLVTKWNTDSSSVKSSYYNPSVAAADWNGYSGNYREDRELDPGTYQVIWLSAWVREVGIDGFRCDTAKHVQPERWGQLKVACQAALEAWRDDTTKSKLYNGVDTGAADWDENFWMTGECFGWTAIDGTNYDYYNTGKFDSMINFSFNGSQTSSTTSSYPSETTWSGYLSINSNPDYDDNGNRNNVLTYISSHDTALCRASNQYNVGTMLQLTPGGIQIYYGDESNRGQAYTGCGDSDMMTRGDMNLSEAKSSALTAHWGKVGTFRKYNPAVGAGTGTAYKRTYSGPAGESKVAIGINGALVDVSGLWDNGTTVYNWYDGTHATVSDGSVTFSGGSVSQPVLVSDRNPANYGVTF